MRTLKCSCETNGGRKISLLALLVQLWSGYTKQGWWTICRCIKRSLKATFLYPMDQHFDIIRKKTTCVHWWHLRGRSLLGEARVVLSRSLVEKQFGLEWSPRVLHWCILLEPSNKACSNPQHDAIAETEKLHLRQKKPVVYGAKDFGKIKGDDLPLPCFLEYQQIPDSLAKKY